MLSYNYIEAQGLRAVVLPKVGNETMPNPKPAPLNVVPDDPTGKTWALPEGAIARLGKGIHRTGPDLDSVALSPDGTYFVAGTGMGLWFYDVSSMSPIALWETERGLISTVNISPDGKSVAFANWDGVVKLLDIESGVCISQMQRNKLYSFVNFLTFSPDSRHVVTAPWKQAVEVLDIQRSECIAQMQLEPINGDFNIYCGVDFSPDGQYLAVTERPIDPDNGSYTLARDGSQTAVWNPMTGELIAKFPGNKFAFSPDNRSIACACPDDTAIDDDDLHQRFISVWDIATSERVAYFEAHEHWIDVVVFSPCGQFITSADRGGSLRVWDRANTTLIDDWTHSGIESKRWNMNQWNLKSYDLEFRMTRLIPSYSTEEKLLAVVFPDETDTVEVWNVDGHEKLQSIERLPGSLGSIWMAKCPELAVAGILHNKSRKTYQTNSWVSLREPTFLPKTDSDLDSARFSVDGQTIVSKNNCGKTVLWDVPHTEKQGLGEKIRSKIYRKMLSDPIRKWSFDISITEQRTEQKQAWETLKNDSRYISIDWSKKKDTRTYSITVSPCRNIIATGLYGEIRLWNIEEPIPVETIPQTKDSIKPYAITFSPCGRYIASGTWWQKGMEKMAIRLWDVETGVNIHTFWGHTTDVQSLTFSPDSTMLASGSFDGTILLWDVKPYINSKD